MIKTTTPLIFPENKISDVSRTSFDNGLQIYVKEKHKAPVVTVQAWVKTGSIHESEYLGHGLSHFLEHMMFQGTEKYPKQKIADIIHKCGGDINAYTSYGCTVYYITLPSEHLEIAIDILSQMLTKPKFPIEKFKDEKKVILRERDMILDSPTRYLSEKMWYNMFQSHPVRHPIIGYHSKIEKVDNKIMLDYYQRRYSPSRTFFVVSGNVDSAKVVTLIKDRLDSWDSGEIYEPMLPVETKQVCARSNTLFFNDPLCRLSLGFHTPSASHQDIPSLDLLAAILGQTQSSRLIKKLQTEQQLAINVNAINYTPYFCGIFGISAVCSSENIEQLENAIFKEIELIKKEIVPKSQLSTLITQHVADCIREMRSNTSLARTIGNTVLTYGSPDYADKYLDDISKVKPDDIMDVANKYLNFDGSNLIKLLPETDAKTIKTNKRKKIEVSKPEIEQLDGDFKLITLQDKSLPLIDFSLVLPGGAIVENENNSGITKVISSMLFAGTKSYSENEIAEICDKNAIDLSITGGNNTLCIRFNCTSDRFDTALNLLESMLSESTFPQKQFEREKYNTLEYLASRAMNPQSVAEDKMCELLYDSHPYANPSVGNNSSITNMKREELSEFYISKCLIKSKSVVGVAGDFDDKSIKKRINSLLNRIPWSKFEEANNLERPKFPEKQQDCKIEIDREQSIVMMGLAGCDNLNPDRYALDIMQPALNGQASKLFKTIRESEGLAYFTGLYTSRGIHEGFIAFYAGTQPETADRVVTLLKKEMQRLAEKGLSKSEFEDAKANIRFHSAQQLQNVGSLILCSVLSQFYGIGYMEPWDKDIAYRALTLADVNKVINRYMATAATVTVIAGT